MKNLAIVSEVKGIGIITEDIVSLKDRFDKTLLFGAQWLGSGFIPGVFYKIYFDEFLTDVIDGVFGIKINVGLGRL